MAEHPADALSYWCSLPAAHKEHLGAVRHWQNLKLATDGQLYWLKDLTEMQANSPEVKTIPSVQVYYTQEGKLFKQGSLLPSQFIPSLLWTPIERAIPLELPSINPNYFHAPQPVEMRLVASDQEQPAFALWTEKQWLRRYLKTAAAARLRPLAWILVGDRPLILGEPLLPLPGQVFWRSGAFLLPAGYALELAIAQNALQRLLDPSGASWLLWNADGSYVALPKEQVQALRRSSFVSL